MMIRQQQQQVNQHNNNNNRLLSSSLSSSSCYYDYYYSIMNQQRQIVVVVVVLLVLQLLLLGSSSTIHGFIIQSTTTIQPQHHYHHHHHSMQQQQHPSNNIFFITTSTSMTTTTTLLRHNNHEKKIISIYSCNNRIKSSSSYPSTTSTRLQQHQQQQQLQTRYTSSNRRSSSSTCIGSSTASSSSIDMDDNTIDNVSNNDNNNITTTTSMIETSSSTTSTSTSTSKQSNKVYTFLFGLYKFTRPHTIRGTILACICGTIRALHDISITTHIPWYQHILSISSSSTSTSASSTSNIVLSSSLLPLLKRAIIGMIALLFGNIYIVGINQIYDVNIDRINKIYLPIVSGELTTQNAWYILILSIILGPILVYQNFPLLLFLLYNFGLVLGTIYSIPPFRTKQNPIYAALTIAIVRGFLLNFGIYYAIQNTFHLQFLWSYKVSFIVRFMTIYAFIIAITKDLPDIAGDIQNNIQTFSTKYGITKIVNGATILLLCNYIHAIITGIIQKQFFNTIPMIGGHTILAFILLLRYKQLKKQQSNNNHNNNTTIEQQQQPSLSSIQLFYKHIWDLFYMEYILYTLI